MLVSIATQSFGCKIQRLIPRRLAKYRRRIAGINDMQRILGDSVSPDQRLQQALRVVYVIEAEAALDAEPAVVRRAVAAHHAQHTVVTHVIGRLTADATV